MAIYGRDFLRVLYTAKKASLILENYYNLGAVLRTWVITPEEQGADIRRYMSGIVGVSEAKNQETGVVLALSDTMRTVKLDTLPINMRRINPDDLWNLATSFYGGLIGLNELLWNYPMKVVKYKICFDVSAGEPWYSSNPSGIMEIHV